MHKQQLRATPTRSPSDLAAFLAVLKDENINILAAGGGDIDRGGEFAFAVEHGKEQRAKQVLEDAGYQPRIVDIDFCAIPDTPGALHGCIERVARKNQGTGKTIRDVIVGVPDGNRHIQVQVYSE